MNTAFQSVKESGYDEVKLIEKFVDPYGSYGPYELKMASRIVKFRVQVLTFGSLKSTMASYISSMSFLSKIIFVLRTVGDGFLVMKSVCDIVRRFIAVFINTINTPSALFRIPVGSMQNDDSLVR